VKNHFSKSLQRFGQSFAFLRNSDWSQLWARKQLNTVFAIRDRIFFRKKRPQSECYPYTVHDPFELFGEDHPYGAFYLVGDAWRDTDSQKPVAICWGFNDWKFGFVAAYLKDYRCAFAPRKITSLFSLIALRRFPVRPTTFVFWGYNEPWLVRLYARSTKGLQILRAEDGFLRSAELGAAHTTPYSLVFDSRGLYYNPNTASDLEEILSHHEFSDKELDDARECLQLMQELRLSKYNPPASGSASRRRIKTRRRVAVIGQVKSDRSVRMGNINRWSEVELVRLAKHENPGAEIVYRPHPDTYRGFQRNFFRRKSVETFCTIVPPDGSLPDFLDDIDHAYVISSLGGLEALLRGIKVTVVGAPFYAGWGLTDDRASVQRRHRKRSLTELFAAVYLTYPRYLASVDSPVLGFSAAAYRINAERLVNAHRNAISELAGTEDSVRALRSFFTELTPCAALGTGPYAGKPLDRQALGLLDLSLLLGKRNAHYYKSVILHALFGRLDSDSSRAYLLRESRKFVDSDQFQELLLSVSRHHYGTYLVVESALFWLEQNQPSLSLEALETRIRQLKAELNSSPNPKEEVIDPQKLLSANPSSDSLPNAQPTPDSPNKASDLGDVYLALIKHQIEQKQFAEAKDIANLLLMNGAVSPLELFPLLWEIAELTFEHESSYHIANLSAACDLFAKNRNALLASFTNFLVVSDALTETDVLARASTVSLLNPERTSTLVTLLSLFLKDRTASDIIERQLWLDNSQTSKKAFALLENGYILHAEEVVLSLLQQCEEHSEKNALLFADICFAKGMHQLAQSTLEKCLSCRPSKAAFVQTIRQFVALGKFREAERIAEESRLAGVDLSEQHTYAILQGLGRTEAAFDCYRRMPFKEDVARYFPGKYTVCLSDKIGSLLLLAAYGPGDEIRFASLYEEVPAYIGASKVCYTCDERLFTLFQRSMPDLEFIAVKRTRSYTPSHRPELFDKLPGSDLCSILDNNALQAVERADGVALVTDLLATMRATKSAFPGHAYLTPDQVEVANLSALLPRNSILVGLSWRSFLSGHTRSIHYLSIEDLAPLFAMPDVTFVNLQYDDCDAELEWAAHNFPGKIINIEEVDLFNDLDKAAALISCLDLVISPATTIAELSGALGVQTWLFGKSAELAWRKRGDTDQDIWHESMNIVLAKRLNNAESVVSELKWRLSAFLCRSSSLIPSSKKPFASAVTASPV
jgi:capsular polysaccharide export protein